MDCICVDVCDVFVGDFLIVPGVEESSGECLMIVECRHDCFSGTVGEAQVEVCICFCVVASRALACWLKG